MTLKGIAVVSIYVYSCIAFLLLKETPLFWQLSLILDTLLLERWFSEFHIEKFSKIQNHLLALIPEKAHKFFPDGKLRTIPVKDIKINDMIIVRPNEMIPADGMVTKGESRVDDTRFTSNGKPVFKGRGDSVLCGSLNIKGFLKIKVKRTGRTTFISYIISLFKRAQSKKIKAREFADNLSRWLSISILLFGVLTFAFWFFVNKSAFSFALQRTFAVFLIACVHSAITTVVLSMTSSISISLKNGLVIKNPQAFEQAVKIDTLIFNKTGTLTAGVFKVHKIISFGVEDMELLKLAASVEKHSRHPIAIGICASIKDTFPVENFNKIRQK